EVRRYAASLREAGNLPIETRVGVNSGEVVVRSLATGDGHAEYTPIGHSTSLAARMQALTPTGSIAARNVAMDSTEKGECGRLEHYLNAVLPALEQFNSSDAVDVAGPQHSKWRELLDRPLPESGQGLDSVLSELQAIVIPNGLRLGAPSFAGWITNAPTT